MELNEIFYDLTLSTEKVYGMDVFYISFIDDKCINDIMYLLECYGLIWLDFVKNKRHRIIVSIHSQKGFSNFVKFVNEPKSITYRPNDILFPEDFMAL